MACPPPTIPVMDKSWILFDPDTGLHVSWYFWLRVLDEVNRSARYGDPFALLLLETTADVGEHRCSLEDAAATVPAAIRSTDLGGLVGPGRVGVILTHQPATSAVMAAERIIQRLDTSRPRGLRWESRLLCYPDDSAEISHLLTAGWDAGRDWGLDSAVQQPA